MRARAARGHHHPRRPEIVRRQPFAGLNRPRHPDAHGRGREDIAKIEEPVRDVVGEDAAWAQLVLEEPDRFNQLVAELIATVDAGRWSRRDPRSLAENQLGQR